jgi:hypothetical protein
MRSEKLTTQMPGSAPPGSALRPASAKPAGQSPSSPVYRPERSTTRSRDAWRARAPPLLRLLTATVSIRRICVPKPCHCSLGEPWAVSELVVGFLPEARVRHGIQKNVVPYRGPAALVCQLRHHSGHIAAYAVAGQCEPARIQAELVARTDQASIGSADARQPSTISSPCQVHSKLHSPHGALYRGDPPSGRAVGSAIRICQVGAVEDVVCLRPEFQDGSLSGQR